MQISLSVTDMPSTSSPSVRPLAIAIGIKACITTFGMPALGEVTGKRSCGEFPVHFNYDYTTAMCPIK